MDPRGGTRFWNCFSLIRNQAVTGGVAGQLRGRTQPGLCHDVVLVELHGSGRDIQDRRNLLDDLALSQQLQNLPLAAC